MNHGTMIRLGAVLAALAVGLGAFGAHGIPWQELGEKSEGQWNTGAQYQMYHALGLILAGLLEQTGRRTRAAAWCFLVGIVVFSGALYVIALGGPKGLGAIAPIGGTAFIAGWLLLAFRK